MVTVYCPHCAGTGRVDRCSWIGPYQAACPHCWQSLGEIEVSESEAHLHVAVADPRREGSDS
jgi:hypothetical protein